MTERPARGALVLLLLCALPAGLACVHRDDDYLLLRREIPRAPGEPTILHFAGSGDSDAAQIRYLLADGFGAELLRTLAMTKRAVRRTREPTYVALGVSDLDPAQSPDVAYRKRVLEAGWFKQAIPAEAPIVWSEGSATDAAVLARLTRGIGAAIVDLIAPGATHPGAPPFRDDVGPYPLRDGYAMFLNVVAAEWHPPRGGDPRSELQAAPTFSEIRSNRATAGPLRTPDRLVKDPRVIATILYRMAASELGRRMTRDEVYQPFLEARPPQGIPPALLLGAFRNFQAKLLAAWARAVAAGKKPVNAVDLVEAYADAYPEERAEVLRIFLITTYGATALPEAIRPQDPPDTVASALAAITADVLFGRRSLRDGLGPLRPARQGRL